MTRNAPAGVLARTPHGLKLVCQDATAFIAPKLVSRSTVLQEIEDGSKDGDEVPLTVHAQLVQLWLAFVEEPAGTSSDCLSVNDLAATLQAADVLGDTQATSELCTLLAVRLFPRPSADLHLLENVMFEHSSGAWDPAASPVAEGTLRDALEKRSAFSEPILAELSGDLVLSVMRAAHNLPTLFRSIPVSFHPLALRAFHPSIDAAQTLSITLPDAVSAAHTARAMTALTRLTSLSLAVSRCRFPMPLHSLRRLLSYASRAPCPLSLDLSRSLPGDGDIALQILAGGLPSLQALSRLVLSGNSITSIGLSILAPCFPCLPNLHVLDLSHTQLGKPDASHVGGALATLPALRELSLSGNNLNDGGWTILSAHLRKLPLTSLDISDCGLRDGFVLLEEEGQMQKTLRALDVSRNHIRKLHPALCEQLRRLPGLESLNVSSVHLRNPALLLGTLAEGAQSHLRALDLSDLPLGEHVGALCKALMHHTALTALSLRSVCLRSEAGAALAVVLQKLQALRELRLTGNGLLEETGAAALVPALGMLTGLELLTLDRCSLKVRGTAAFTSHCVTLSRLKALDLSSNHLGADGAVSVLAFLPKLPALRVLRMRSNGIACELQDVLGCQHSKHLKIHW